VVGVYHWLPQLQVALLAEQHQSEAFRATYTTLGVGLGIALVAVAMAVVIGLVVTRSITNPLSSLAETSKQIAAGDLTARAQHIASGDEIGLLATNFNVMADRVTGLLKGLEERSRALETSAQVSRRLSTILDQGHLVAAVVEQVQQAFGYYHAHIYLIDEASGDLAMAGGTGEAGREMLARGHKIPRGKGLVGRAAETQAVVLVPDVSHEEGWLPNPLLPDTRSEIAVPILAGERVLGVLDVQQNVSGGLSETDADLLESIAGQVAVALHNTRLFAETRRKAEYEARLNLINQNVQRATSLESLLQVAARELGGALGAQRVSIQLAPSTDGDQLRK
jgi:GAF domain-containing protein/HAMP domain-containing protein